MSNVEPELPLRTMTNAEGEKVTLYPIEFGKNALNVKDELIIKNVTHSMNLQLPQAPQGNRKDEPLVIVGGGWSLNDTFNDLRKLHFERRPIVALNGAGNWLLERNIRPSMQMIMDARPENIDFLKEPIPDCKYFLASQCDPELFEMVKDRETYIFHLCSLGVDSEEEQLLNDFYLGRWKKIPGGGTIGMRSIGLLWGLGYQLFHIFGLDSCLSPEDGSNHAYKQDWNPTDSPAHTMEGVWCGDREFTCTKWQAVQAHQFKEFIKSTDGQISLSVYGNGLIAHMIKTGAEAVVKEREDGSCCMVTI